MDTYFKEGKEEGLQEGEQIGEHKKAIKTAEKCLLKGMTVEETAELTELSVKEVQKIATKLGL
ncbi:MAG: aspartate aminotransferase [Bacteroidetes bacterium]|nr:MAG: aspartate aminotransferase [Bacteroidota bacterium]